jgi:transcriptional regulator with XRE-family HTH domain
MDDVVNAVGTNVRRLRVQRGVSTAELARRSDVARATLTALEAGRGNPTLETLYALARVLDVSLAEIITDPRTPASAVLRADEGVWVSGSSVDARLLDRLDRHLRTDLYDIVIRAGTPQLSAAHQAGVIESFLCHDGSVRIGPSDEPVEVSAGDFTRFRADVPHTYEAVGGDARGVLIIQTPWAVGPA